jgi:hypothetical protein
MVVDAVGFEPVSSVKFPANREINREFCKIQHFRTNSRAWTRANPMACGEIPYAQNRELFPAEQGILAQKQGIFFSRSNPNHQRTAGSQPAPLAGLDEASRT